MRKLFGLSLTCLCGAMVYAVVATTQVPSSPVEQPEVVTIPTIIDIPVPSPPEKVEPKVPEVQISTTIVRPKSNCEGGVCSMPSSRATTVLRAAPVRSRLFNGEGLFRGRFRRN